MSKMGKDFSVKRQEKIQWLKLLREGNSFDT